MVHNRQLDWIAGLSEVCVLSFLFNILFHYSQPRLLALLSIGSGVHQVQLCCCIFVNIFQVFLYFFPYTTVHLVSCTNHWRTSVWRVNLACEMLPSCGLMCEHPKWVCVFGIQESRTDVWWAWGVELCTRERQTGDLWRRIVLPC